MKKAGVLLVVFMLVSGCKSLTSVTPTARIDTSLRPKVVQQQIEQNTLLYETLQWRGQAILDRGGKRQKISLSTRLKYQEGVWLNGSIIVPLARVLVTPEQVQFYEKIKRQYASLNYKKLEELLGVKVAYTMLENILTAKPVVARALKRSKLSHNNNTYVFSYSRKGMSLQFVYDASFRLVEQRLVSNETTISVVYDTYQKINTQWIPKTLRMTLYDKKGETSLTLNAKQTELNEALKMPFKIPEGYTPILIQ